MYFQDFRKTLFFIFSSSFEIRTWKLRTSIQVAKISGAVEEAIFHRNWFCILAPGNPLGLFLIDFMILYYSWVVGFSKFSSRSTLGWKISSGFWVSVGNIFSFPTWLTLDLFIVITYLAIYKSLIVARIQWENISEHHRKKLFQNEIFQQI